MTRSIEDIDYTHLSAAERLLLAQDILNSVVSEVQCDSLTPEQITELDRRFAAVKSGEEATYPWSQVQAELSEGR